MKKILVVLMAMLTMAIMVAGCGGDSKKAAYPADGDISVIIPKAPGGGTDTSARGLIQFMEKELKGSKFVPVNKPDGGGVTGMVELANAKPDGHTLGMVTVELAMFPHQGKCKNTYKDYAAICAPIAAPAALIVAKDAPYNNVDEFVAFAKANPGKVKMGNSGIGAIWHILLCPSRRSLAYNSSMFRIRKALLTLLLLLLASISTQPWLIRLSSRARWTQAT